MNLRRFSALIALLLFVSSASAHAAAKKKKPARPAAVVVKKEQSTSPAKTAADLGTIIVTASRTAEKAEDAAASVIVFTREDIDRLKPRDLADLFRALPGVSVAQNGGPGQVQTVFLRGNESRHTLVLIDGARAGTVETPGFGFEYLPMEQIERVEIVQGPRSALYGSQAFGGVVNLITRKDTGTRLRLQGGNLGSHGVSAGTGWLGDNGASAGLSAGYKSTQGYDVTLPGAFNHDDDEDGFRSRDVGAHFAAPLLPGLRLSGNGSHVEGRTRFDQEFNDFILEQYHAGLEWQAQPSTLLTLGGGYTRERRDFDQPFTFGFYADNQRATLNTQVAQSFAGLGSAIVGFDYADDYFRSQGAQSTARRDRAGYFLLRPEFGDWRFEFGSRFEDESTFGFVHTAQGSASYAVLPTLDVYVNGGSAFRAPTFQERFGGPFNIANTNVQPESTQSYEAGLRWQHEGWRYSVAGYQSYVRNLITFNSVGADNIAFSGDEFFENTARTHINGVELKTDGRIWDTRIAASYAYSDARNADTQALLLRRPKQTARLDLDRRWNRLSYGLTVQAEGNRADAGNTAPAGFVTFNLRSAYEVCDRISVDASIINLLDKRYTTVTNFRASPIAATLGLNLRL